MMFAVLVDHILPKCEGRQPKSLAVIGSRFKVGENPVILARAKFLRDPEFRNFVADAIGESYSEAA
jgi:hypothetical protein